MKLLFALATLFSVILFQPAQADTKSDFAELKHILEQVEVFESRFTQIKREHSIYLDSDITRCFEVNDPKTMAALDSLLDISNDVFDSTDQAIDRLKWLSKQDTRYASFADSIDSVIDSLATSVMGIINAQALFELYRIEHFCFKVEEQSML